MSRIFQRRIGVDLPTAVRGEGMYIVDGAGKRYLDASGGAAVSCLGHSDADVRRAIKEQVDKLAFAHTGFFTSEPAEALADVLIEGAPAGIERVYFMSGGSEAVEAALKMARQYFLETGRPERARFIARRQSFHGTTLGALAVGGHRARRAPYQPMLTDVTHISPCYAYCGMEPGESEEEYGRRVADELEAAIVKLGPESVAAFVAETVVGSSLGAVPPAPGYFKRIRDICDRHGVLLIRDEVMCGMGRTGTLHACEQDGIVPDLLTVAKGLFRGIELVADRATREPFDPGLKIHARVKSEAMDRGLICYPDGRHRRRRPRRPRASGAAVHRRGLPGGRYRGPDRGRHRRRRALGANIRPRRRRE